MQGTDAMPRIARVPYLLRLVGVLLIATVLYVLMIVALRNARDADSLLAFFLVLAAGFLVNVVGFVYVISKYVLLPRLRDAGFMGPLLWLMLFLCILPATAPFFVLALLFLPAGFVRTSPGA